MYRTSWPKDHSQQAKEKGTALYLLGIKTPTDRGEIGGHHLDPGTAWKLFRFVVLLGGGVTPRIAFENAFGGSGE